MRRRRRRDRERSTRSPNCAVLARTRKAGAIEGGRPPTGRVPRGSRSPATSPPPSRVPPLALRASPGALHSGRAVRSWRKSLESLRVRSEKNSPETQTLKRTNSPGRPIDAASRASATRSFPRRDQQPNGAHDSAIQRSGDAQRSTGAVASLESNAADERSGSRRLASFFLPADAERPPGPTKTPLAAVVVVVAHQAPPT